MNCKEISQNIIQMRELLDRLNEQIDQSNVDAALQTKHDIESYWTELYNTNEFVKIKIAKEILGQDFQGIEETQKALDIDTAEVPPMPFSIEDIKKAKELGLVVEYRTNKFSDGTPFTIQNLAEKMEGKCPDESPIICPDFKNTLDFGRRSGLDLSFYHKITPRKGWVMIDKKVIPDSASTDEKQNGVFRHIELLIDFMKNNFFKDKSFPLEYKEAVDEFEEKKEYLLSLTETDINNRQNEKAVEEFSKLKITPFLFDSMVESVYDYFCNYINNDEILFRYHDFLSTDIVQGFNVDHKPYPGRTFFNAQHLDDRDRNYGFSPNLAEGFPSGTLRLYAHFTRHI